MLAMATLMAQSQGQGQQPPAKKSKKGDDGISISSSCTYLFQLPTLRMRIMIETIHGAFDTISTGKWEFDPLMRLVWLLSGMEANLQVLPICAISGFGIGLSGLALQLFRFTKGDARVAWGGGRFLGMELAFPYGAMDYYSVNSRLNPQVVSTRCTK